LCIVFFIESRVSESFFKDFDQDQEKELMIREFLRVGEQITIQDLYEKVLEKVEETGI